MSFTLTNTITNAPETVKTTDDKHIKMYCCGPTVYAAAHIGNFRTFIQQDLLRRVLELDAKQRGLKVIHVRNLTDVDDKTIKQANTEGVPLKTVTDRWIKKFHEDCAALNLLTPHYEPRATEYIPQQIKMVEILLENGSAYKGEDNSIYFRNEQKGKKTRLGIDLEGLEASNDNHDTARDRRSDFVVWKAYKPVDGQVKWNAPFGEGRPGWHIECSAMANAILGDTIDLHAGGVDLKFPHHESEILQSEAATGKEFCRHWCHCEHLLVNGKKMAKSLNNFWTLDDLTKEGWSPQVIRLTLLGSVYSSQQNFTKESLFNSLQTLRTLKEYRDQMPKVLHSTKESDKFKPVHTALNNDLNVPQALGVLFTTISANPAKTLTAEDAKSFDLVTGDILGIDLTQEIDLKPTKEAATLAERRWEARANKDFAQSDTLRKQITQLGYELLDLKGGYTLRRDMKKVVEQNKVVSLEIN